MKNQKSAREYQLEQEKIKARQYNRMTDWWEKEKIKEEEYQNRINSDPVFRAQEDEKLQRIAANINRWK